MPAGGSTGSAWARSSSPTPTHGGGWRPSCTRASPTLCDARAAALAPAGHELAFYEASLLVETGRHQDFDGLVVVTASPETQIARAMARDHLTRDQARARIDAQLPMAEKVAVATHVIDNGGDPTATAAQVARLLGELGWSG